MIIKNRLKVVFILTALALMVAMSGLFGFNSLMGRADADEPLPEAEPELKIAVLSDTHYYPASYMTDNAAFNKAVSLSNTLLVENVGVLEEAIKLITEDAPDVLLITGDLSRTGEIKAHESMAYRLGELEFNTGIKVYVINGAADIANPDAFDYKTNKAANKTSALEFAALYADFGYSEAIARFNPAQGKKAGGLSYAVRPMDGFTFIAVDTAKYSADATASGLDEGETGGAVGEDLLNWVDQQARAAVERGDRVFAFQHHNLVSRFSAETLFFSGHLVDDYLLVAETYADAGIELVFTGFMHANDIAMFTSDAGNVIYDIASASIVSYPSSYRVCTFFNQEVEDKIKLNAQVETKYIAQQAGALQITNPLDTSATIDIEDLTEYTKEKSMMSAEKLNPIAKDLVKGLVDGFLENGGVMQLVVDLLAQYGIAEGGLEEMLESFLETSLPTSVDEAMELEGVGKVYYNVEGGYIRLEFELDDISGYVHIYSEDIIKTAEEMALGIENDFFHDFTFIGEQIETMVQNLMSYTFDGVEQTVEEILNFCYLGFLYGDEAQNLEGNDWIFDALGLFEIGQTDAVNGIINDIFKPAMAIVLDEMLKSATISYSTLIREGQLSTPLGNLTITNGSVNIPLLGTRTLDELFDLLGADILPRNLYGIISLFVEDFTTEVFLDTLLDEYMDDMVIAMLNMSIYGLIESLIVDSNYVEDNFTTITFLGYIPVDNGNGNGDGDGDGDGCGGCACGSISFGSFTTLMGLMIPLGFVVLKSRRQTSK